MLETIIKLLERFVVAHELIAANSAKQTVIEKVGEVLRATETPTKGGSKEAGEKFDAAVKEQRAEDDDIAETKPAKKPRQTKPKEEPKGPDLAELRDDIKTIAKHIAAGESDECADKFDELLEDFKVRTVTKLHDDDVEEFHKEAKKLVGKYYEISED
ncbi:MAG: hypothetical protein ACRCZO_16155 [Cetobacterium sp.]